MPLSRPIPRAPQLLNWKTLTVVVISVTLSLMLRIALDDILGTRAPFMILLLAVSASAVYGGLINGLFAVLLSALLGTFFLIEPVNTFAITDVSEVSRLILFVIVGLGISLMCEMLRQSRHHAEELHRRALANQMEYRELVEAAGSLIVRVDLTGHITFVNRFAQEFFGSSESQLMGQLIVGTLLPATDQQGHDLAIMLQQSTAQHTTSPTLELEHRRNGQSPAWVAWYNRPLRDAKGQLREILCIGMDITARKTLERELRDLTATLEQRVADRTEEVERTAVQLRALANQLTQAEERERRRLAQVLHDHLQQLLVAAKMRVSSITAQVRSSAHLFSLLEQVQELLSQSIAESRSLTAELSPPILYDSGLGMGLDWLARWFHEKHNLIVNVQHQDDQPHDIPESIRVVLFRVVRELLLNIVKHAGTESASIHMDLRPSHVKLVVEDHGRGFDAGILKSRNSIMPGFGILSIRERVAAMGGTFVVDSAPGRGTIVTIEVPLQLAIPATDHPDAASPAADSSADGSDKSQARAGMARPRVNGKTAAIERSVRVILADDHKILREGLVGMLDLQPGIEVIAQAASGREVLELARRHQPDVVVMDINMPLMNGIEATRMLKNEMPGLFVIGLSMHTEQDLASAMRQAGAVNYLSKDGPLEDLVAAIRACGQRLGLYNNPAVT